MQHTRGNFLLLAVCLGAVCTMPSDAAAVTGPLEHDLVYKQQLEFFQSIADAVNGIKAPLMPQGADEFSGLDDDEVQKEVCYQFVGCFSLTNGSLKHVGVLPISPESVAPKYMLYDVHHADKEILLKVGNLSKRELAPYFSNIRNLTLVAHGFGESTSKKWTTDMKDALLREKRGNVILIDWYWGALKPWYSRATANCEMMGRLTAVLIMQLMDLFPHTLHPKNVHFVGFSLGAQMAGFAGRWFIEHTGKKLGRITGLDAASPFFEDHNVILTKQDAEYVDAIHTSAGNSILTGKLGVVQPYGHVDFYPNGGSVQPGCPFYLIACHHQRAFDYFTESLTNKRCEFASETCEDSDPNTVIKGECKPVQDVYGLMGFRSFDAPGRGMQYLTTNKAAPFCVPGSKNKF